MDISSLITALGDVADLINSGSDTDATLRQLVVAACRHGDWLRGSIMSIDLASGYGYVTVRHDPTLQLGRPEDQWILATSPSLVALRDNRPVIIPDAQASDEFPGFRKESRERGYCSVLVMPMRCTDLLGRPMVLTVNSERVKSIGPTDLALMKLIVHLGSIAVEKQKAIAEQKDAALQREMVLSTHTRLMQQAISDDSVQKLSDAIHPIIQRPALIVDLTTDAILVGTSPKPKLLDDPEWHEIVETQLRTRLRRLPFETMRDDVATLTEFHITLERHSFDLVARVYPLRIDGRSVGALMIFSDDELTEYDQLLIGSIRLAISVQLMRNLIRFQFERRTLDDLFAEIIESKWKNENDLAQRALKFEIRLNRAHRMIVVSFPESDGLAAATLGNVQRGITLLFDGSGSKPVVIGYADCMIILVPATKNSTDEYVRELMLKVMREVRHYTSIEPISVLSALCIAPQDYQGQWKSCRSILDIAQAFGKRGVLSAEDFGPLPTLLSTANADSVRDVVRRTLGAVLDHDERNETQFFITLKAYINSGCRNQQCADALGIHVTTLRYRLAKASDLFRLDLESSTTRFDVELAIRLHDLCL
ncbi:helix-turn-helix domain-containing protein [Pseudaminobacter salicylatoxidans]|uniref:helix-turn-helix domain-containing protein n=1 Tax=Pseudaminobacter salicylatoxidans TaxID=93369 RepID=UPI000313FFA8|nr:helix-turn-helix domain-containing protein [Pseudaminobacter salicylatoxidans]